jgi:hypothetical protein
LSKKRVERSDEIFALWAAMPRARLFFGFAAHRFTSSGSGDGVARRDHAYLELAPGVVAPPLVKLALDI